MSRRTFLPCALFFIFLLKPQAPAQEQPVAGSSAQSPAVRQSAMNMLEEVLAGTGSLALPQNRLAIELQAFPILWTRSSSRARALINQMAGEFAQAVASSNEDSDQNPQYKLTRLREQRSSVARTIAGSDAEMALLFLSATLPYVQSNLPGDDAEDHALLLDLAAQVALRDPHRALQLAEQELKESGDLPPSFISLLEQVERNDAEAGARLFRDVVDHIKRQNLSEESEELSFAASLLANQFSRQSENGGPPDPALRSLAEIVATAAASSTDQPNLLNQALPALNALVPTQSAPLRPQTAAFAPAVLPGKTVWQQVNEVRASGDTDKLLAIIAHAPEDDRTRIAQQEAWIYASTGDLQRTRILADTLDPWQRNNMIQQATRCASAAAGTRGDFATARQLAAQVTDQDSRATLLSELALAATSAGKPRVAEDILGEAASLVINRTAGGSAFAALLVVAQAYLRVNPAQAVPLLERAASQLEQVLAAAAQLDGFLPDRHSFEGTELILNEGFLYQSLILPYAMTAADLATIDLSAARTLADRLPLPEARLMTELFVARSALGEQSAEVQISGLRNLSPRY